MDIRFYTANTSYVEHRSPIQPVSDYEKAAGHERSATEKTAGNYDKATFRSSSAASDDSSFAAAMTRALSAKVSNGTNAKRVAELGQQVASGTYVPDSRRIAERILGYR